MVVCHRNWIPNPPRSYSFPPIFPDESYTSIRNRIRKSCRIDKNYHTSSDPHPDPLFWHSFWHIISNYIWQAAGIYFLTFLLPFFLTFFLAVFLTFYLTFSAILSDTCSDILLTIFWHPILTFFPIFLLTFFLWHCIWHMFWHSICQSFCTFLTFYVRAQSWPTASRARDIEFGSRRGPLHPELAIWLGSIHAHSHNDLAEEDTRRRTRKRKRRRSLTWQAAGKQVLLTASSKILEAPAQATGQ